ncbi:hypothetical protein D3C81_1761010 [compost metagenome]
MVEGLRSAGKETAAEQAHGGHRRFFVEQFKQIEFVVKHLKCGGKRFFNITVHAEVLFVYLFSNSRNGVGFRLSDFLVS